MKELRLRGKVNHPSSDRRKIRGLNWVCLFHSLGSSLYHRVASYEHVQAGPYVGLCVHMIACMCLRMGVCSYPNTHTHTHTSHKSLPFVFAHRHTLEPGFTVLKPGKAPPSRRDALLPKVATMLPPFYSVPFLDPDLTLPRASGLDNPSGSGCVGEEGTRLWAAALSSPLPPPAHEAVTRDPG